ncbi:PREDICTED: aspartyl protease family protein 2-like [Tarenaya hassleriana]|uniref:aspartyl protease family protein 2-like n=1 Tax=Tarenaya hassleriana TaxID=28532 RepID=UPI00053C1185|nr:PREDICTED: aspartyl protease family protein 2-like [Tarenaya hassleriana]
MSTVLCLILCLVFFSAFSSASASAALAGNYGNNISSLAGFHFPDPPSFSSVSYPTSNDCSFSSPDDWTGEFPGNNTVRLHLKHREINRETDRKKSVVQLNVRDLTRIQTLHRRVKEKKNQNMVSRLQQLRGSEKQEKVKTTITSAIPPANSPAELSSQLVATLESGMSQGSGEYFMDVLVGTPPKHYSLILDTGSDLNWIQCLPCYDCFEQNGTFYDPKASTSFANITCRDPRCSLVSSPDPLEPCRSDNQSCPYFYWYGDSSNTTGDFAVETFTVNLTTGSGNSEYKKLENVMFGCGHWNRGLFHGAAGLLGLGRGPLSFSSQLQSLYGHSFSYCLVDRNSDANVSSKLIFGEDKDLLSHPNLNFTTFVAGKENPVDTFYYVQIRSILVGGEVLNIPEGTWNISSDGTGGTIVDSGTTLSYFAEPAYTIIRDKLLEKLKGKYPVFRDFPILDPCFNVSGVEEKVELPELGITFADGAVWNFPVKNTFIWLDESLVCLAVLGTPTSAFSIIGNYQQQNFHIIYDTKKSRLGFAPMSCADI